MNQMVYVGLVGLGLCLGSFVNALVWRVHEQSKSKNKRAAIQKDLSVVSGRSMCPSCQHTLAWYDLLPVVSWLMLRGQCRYCHKPISWQYPGVEIATAALFVASYGLTPLDRTSSYFALLLGLWLVLLVGFMALAVYDLRWMILPDRIVFPMQAIAVVYVLARFAASGADGQMLLGTFGGVLVSAGIFYVLYQVSDGRWIGGGDVKLGVILGLVLGGALESFLMIFVASLLGSIIGIPLLLRNKAHRQTKLPFGPLLIVATVLVYLFGATLITWHKSKLFLM